MVFIKAVCPVINKMFCKSMYQLKHVHSRFKEHVKWSSWSNLARVGVHYLVVSMRRQDARIEV